MPPPGQNPTTNPATGLDGHENSERSESHPSPPETAVWSASPGTYAPFHWRLQTLGDLHAGLGLSARSAKAATDQASHCPHVPHPVHSSRLDSGTAAFSAVDRIGRLARLEGVHVAAACGRK
jgi:hypothetical protein